MIWYRPETLKYGKAKLGCFWLSVCAAILPATADASGYVAMPEIRTQLSSHRECVEKLQAAAAGQQGNVKPLVVQPDGTSHETRYEDSSKGVVRLSRTKSRYEGRVWYTNGRRRPDIGAIEFTHSWQGLKLECVGRIYIFQSVSGYTLNTYEPFTNEHNK